MKIKALVLVFPEAVIYQVSMCVYQLSISRGCVLPSEHMKAKASVQASISRGYVLA